MRGCVKLGWKFRFSLWEFAVTWCSLARLCISYSHSLLSAHWPDSIKKAEEGRGRWMWICVYSSVLAHCNVFLHWLPMWCQHHITHWPDSIKKAKETRRVEDWQVSVNLCLLLCIYSALAKLYYISWSLGPIPTDLGWIQNDCLFIPNLCWLMGQVQFSHVDTKSPTDQTQ